jgi:UDP-N-acetylmuramoyl-tripeptide--D-alanyl-D-alanine ligase
MQWTLKNVAGVLGVALPAQVDPLAGMAGVSIDSRTVRAGELFIAIHGPRHDGHDFVAAALAAGAAAALVEERRVAQLPEETLGKILVVDGTMDALQTLARAVRRAWAVVSAGRKIAAVTGSTGKTTTKEILAALLAERGRVHRSEGNLNNEYGLPLTLLKLEEGHQAAVVELGMSARGEIARLAQIAEPEIGLVTNVAPVHLEFFSSVDEIALAKRELFEGLAGKDPVAVLNADDARVARFAEGFTGRVLRYGFRADATFRAENFEDRGPNGSAFDCVFPGGRARLELPLAGRHNVLNALGALAAASEWQLTPGQAQAAFRKMRPAAMRGEVLRLPEGVTVINDCYNSNPVALEAMLGVLAATPGRRRILVAGEMLELGATAPQLHFHSGRAAALRKVDWVFGVQGHAAQIVAGAVDAGLAQGRTAFFESSQEAAVVLADFVAAGDAVLVKGSRGVQMEKIVAALQAKFAGQAPGVSEAGPSTPVRGT